MSIDPRPPQQPDERGVLFKYPENSTRRMIETLTPRYGDKLGKLQTFDLDARQVPQLTHAPDMCFIDGEHTDAAVLSDVESCLRLGARTGVFAFDDAHIVFRGYARALDLLTSVGIAHRAYLLPRKIGIIEIGDIGLWRDPWVHERLASAAGYLFVAETLAHYRDGILALKRLPGAELVRRLLSVLPLARELRPRVNRDSGAYEHRLDEPERRDE